MAREFTTLALCLSCLTIYLSTILLWGGEGTGIATKPAFANFHVDNRSEFIGVTQAGKLPATQSDVNLVTTRVAKCDRPVTNFVFMKVHKTASGSTFMVLARFGRNHNMTICFPARREKARHIQLSYPSGKLTKNDCRPALGRNYTLIIHHSVMNKPAMDRVMAPGTKYIGIFREPLKHFRSIFFWKRKKFRHSKNPIGAFLDASGNRKKRPYSKHHNFQAYTMGFPSNLLKSKNSRQIYDTIRTVAGWYSVVLITEYWEESMVLLRRKFCWTMFDILHTTNKLHALHTSKEHATLTDKQLQTHRRISNVDYMMYDYLNKTFWQRVTEEGPAFWEEVTYYKTLNLQVNQHCKSAGGKRVFPVGKWSQEFAIDSTFCKELKWREGQWANACWNVVERRNEKTTMKKPNVIE